MTNEPVATAAVILWVNCQSNQGFVSDRSRHIVGELPEQPGVREQFREALNGQLPVVEDTIRHGVLHPGIRGQNEIAGKPGTDPQHRARHPQNPAATSRLTEEEHSQERGLQKKGEDSLHRQRLTDNPPCVIGKRRPIRAELKFQRDTGDDAKSETQGKDAGPEASDLMKVLTDAEEIPGAKVQDEQRQAHGELGKQIMKCRSDGELQAVIL